MTLNESSLHFSFVKSAIGVVLCLKKNNNPIPNFQQLVVSGGECFECLKCLEAFSPEATANSGESLFGLKDCTRETIDTFKKIWGFHYERLEQKSGNFFCSQVEFKAPRNTAEFEHPFLGFLVYGVGDHGSCHLGPIAIIYPFV